MTSPSAKARELFKARLIQSITAKRLKNAEIATALGVTRQSVDKWVAGTAWPTPENLDRISQYFGRPLKWFFTSDDEPEGDVRALVGELRDVVDKIERIVAKET